MTDCPTCGHPMIVSEDRARPWCSVYGSHTAAPDATELDRRHLLGGRRKAA